MAHYRGHIRSNGPGNKSTTGTNGKISAVIITGEVSEQGVEVSYDRNNYKELNVLDSTLNYVDTITDQTIEIWDNQTFFLHLHPNIVNSNPSTIFSAEQISIRLPH